MTVALFADFMNDWSQYFDNFVDFFELLLSISFSVALAWPTLPSFAMIQFTWAFTGVAVQQGLSLFMDAYPVVLCAVVVVQACIHALVCVSVCADADSLPHPIPHHLSILAS